MPRATTFIGILSGDEPPHEQRTQSTLGFCRRSSRKD